MFETLQQIDTAVFFFINMTLSNPVTDFIMPYVTNDTGLRIGYGLVMILCLIRGDAKLRWMVLFSVIVLVLTDQITAGLLKDFIGRFRPCQSFSTDTINLLVGCGGGKSMPSAHAANALGQALFFSLYYPKIKPYLIRYAVLVALSRVFVGVHYPFDVLVGSLIGIIIAIIFVKLFDRFEKKFIEKKKVKLFDDEMVDKFYGV